VRLPDFIIGGAPRAGTTWLYELLDRHPDVYMAKPLKPEPKFFLRDEVYAKGLAHYSQTWFAGADTRKMAGEISEGMIFDLGYADGLTPVLAQPEKPVPNGTRAG